MRALLILLAACSTSGVGERRVDALELDAAQPDGCAAVRVYPDVDGDGFGDATSAGVLACSGVTNNTDCADQDANARPGQTEHRGVPITGPTQHGLAYDYNCDGVETPELTATVVCQTRAICGGAVNAWAGQNTPACGVTWPFVSACTVVNNGSGPFCSPANATDRVQGCL
jgi:hypothetical protein